MGAKSSLLGSRKAGAGRGSIGGSTGVSSALVLARLNNRWVKEKESGSHSVMSDSLQPCGL